MHLLIFKTRVLRFSLDAMKAFFFVFLIPLVFSLSAVTTAHAYTVPETPPSAWNRGSFGVQTHSEFFSSHNNYEETRGSFDKLVNDNKWTSFENRVKLRFGLADWASVYTGVGAASTSATSNGVTRNNASLNEVYLGADFVLARRWWRVIPEIEASYPTDETNRLQTNPLSSDGVAYANAGIWMFKPYRYLRFEGYIGMHMPGQQFATRFMYNLGAEVAAFGAFTFGGAIQGYESVIADGTSHAERKLTQASADGTSMRFWAYNPALLEAKGWVGLRFDKSFGVRLGYSKTLNGVRTAEGQSFLLSLYYNTVGTGARRGPGPASPRERERERDRDNFKTEPEPNDPQIFEQPKTPDATLDSTERLFDR
jgi:hypothetical protein